MTDEQCAKITMELGFVIPTLLQMDLAGLLHDLSEYNSKAPLYLPDVYMQLLDGTRMVEKSITALYQCQQVLKEQLGSGEAE